jgi:hypothetical protein
VPALPLEWFIGPVAALALALAIGRELWRAHKEADQRERDRTDALEKRLAEWTEIFKRAKPE